MRKGDYGELSATARRLQVAPQTLHQRRRVKAGCCAVCGATRDPDSSIYCSVHLRAQRTWRQQYEDARRAHGLCIKCDTPSPDYRRCDACRQKANSARRRGGY